MVNMKLTFFNVNIRYQIDKKLFFYEIDNLSLPMTNAEKSLKFCLLGQTSKP